MVFCHDANGHYFGFSRHDHRRDRSSFGANCITVRLVFDIRSGVNFSGFRQDCCADLIL